jgi:hypothetical protein
VLLVKLDDIKMDVQTTVLEAVVSIQVLQDREEWQAFANTAMDLLDHKMWDTSCLAEDLVASLEGLHSMGLVR